MDMNIELQSQLFLRYPLLFRKAPRGSDQAGPIDYWGIECGDGWFELLDRLCATLESYIHQQLAADSRIPAARLPRVAQIKEKFGLLRVHLRCQRLPESLRQAKQQAESQSAHICENCGRPGRLHTERYRVVTCDMCMERVGTNPETLSDTDLLEESLRVVLDQRLPSVTAEMRAAKAG